jgi:hypothetical protein
LSIITSTTKRGVHPSPMKLAPVMPTVGIFAY